MVLDQSMRLKQLKYEREHTHTHTVHCINTHSHTHTHIHTHTHSDTQGKKQGSADRPALMGNFYVHVAHNFIILY